MFRTVSLSIIRSISLYTQQWYMSYRFAVSKPVWHKPLLCVQCKTPDDGQRNYPKHVVLLCYKYRHLAIFIVVFWLTFTAPYSICYIGLLTACEEDQDGTGIRRELVPSWSCSQAVTVTCMTYTVAVCTVKNSWWWTEKLSETRRVLFQK